MSRRPVGQPAHNHVEMSNPVTMSDDTSPLSAAMGGDLESPTLTVEEEAEEEEGRAETRAAWERDDEPPPECMESDRPVLHVSARLYRLDLHDEATNSFTCELSLWVHWTDPAAIGLTEDRMDEWQRLDGPIVRFENVQREVHRRDARIRGQVGDIRVKDPVSGLCHLHIWLEGVFTHNCTLHAFPFDTQELSVIVRVPHANQRCLLKRRRIGLKGHSVLISRELALPGWHVLEPYLQLQYPTSVDMGVARPGKPQIRVVIPIQRDYTILLGHICSVMVGLSAAVFLAFAVSPAAVADRASILLTLLLAQVATKYLVADKLPACPLGTWFDRFVWATLLPFGLMGVQIPVSAAVWTRVSPDVAWLVDCVGAFGSLALWLGWQAILAIQAVREQRHIAATQPPILVPAGGRAPSYSPLLWNAAPRLKK